MNKTVKVQSTTFTPRNSISATLRVTSVQCESFLKLFFRSPWTQFTTTQSQRNCHKCTEVQVIDIPDGSVSAKTRKNNNKHKTSLRDTDTCVCKTNPPSPLSLLNSMSIPVIFLVVAVKAARRRNYYSLPMTNRR